MLTPLPTAESVGHVLRGLLGRSVRVASAEPSTPPAALATFVDAAGTPRALAAMDASFTCFTGAALSLIPRTEFEDSLEDGNPNETVREGFQEVAAVLSRLLNEGDGPRHLLGEILFLADEPMSDELRELASHLLRRVDLDVEIEGYGTGSVSILA